MKTTANTSHIVVNNPRHRRGWIPLRSAVMRESRLSSRRFAIVQLETISCELRMSRLVASRMIMPGDEMNAVIYQDGYSLNFRGRVVDWNHPIEYNKFRPHKKKLKTQSVTMVSITVDLVPDNSNASLFTTVAL